MRVTHSSKHAVAPDEVVRVLCSEAYNVQVERDREGVVETRFVRGSDGDPPRSFELRTTEYARTKTGGLDRSRTLRSTTRSELDPASRTVRWRYEAEEGSRIRLSGSVRVAGDGNGSRVDQAVEVEVSIPLVGGQIAKLIGKQVEKTLPETARVLAEHLES